MRRLCVPAVSARMPMEADSGDLVSFALLGQILLLLPPPLFEARAREIHMAELAGPPTICYLGASGGNQKQMILRRVVSMMYCDDNR